MEKKILKQKFELQHEIKKIDEESNKLRKELKKAVFNSDENGVKTLAKSLIRRAGTKSRLQDGIMQLKSFGFKLTNIDTTQILVNEITQSFYKQIENMQKEINTFHEQIENLELVSTMIEEQVDVVFQDDQGKIKYVLEEIDDDELAFDIHESVLEVSKINKIKEIKSDDDFEKYLANIQNI